MKYIKLLIVSVFVFFISISTVFASSNTYTRTKYKPLVPKDVTVTDDNIEEILKTPAVSSKEKIYDFADVYTDAQETELYEKIVDYMNLAKVDIAIVTTKSLNGIKDVEKYAYNFYDYNDFKKNGIILVIYITDNSFNLYMDVVGDNKDIKKIYTEKEINDSLAYISTFFAKKDYYTGTYKYIGLLKGYYNKSGVGNREVNEDGDIVKRIPVIEIIVLALALTFIIVMILFYKLKNNNKKDDKDVLDSKIDNSTLMVKLEKDELITGEK